MMRPRVLARQSSTTIINPTPKRNPPPSKKVTLQALRSMFRKREPITVLTAHDYPSGMLCDRAGVDVCLVGDSLAMVALGYENTNEITLSEMIHHSKAVARGCKTSFLVGDMPFGSYERSPEYALDNAVEFLRNGKVEAVKMEGGVELSPHVKKLTQFGIPCVGHVGLTPQRQNMFGGFRVQGKTFENAKRIVNDALELQSSGIQMIVLEAIPQQVAAVITSLLTIPTIGIGAGPNCSGQVLVQLDALGMFDRFLPKRFCKVYSDIGAQSTNAIELYCQQVRSGEFPNPVEHVYSMQSQEELEAFEAWSKQFQL